MIEIKLLIEAIRRFFRKKTYTVLILVILINVLFYNLFWTVPGASDCVWWIKLIFHSLLSGFVWYMLTYHMRAPWLILISGAKWNIYQIGNPQPYCVSCHVPLMPTVKANNIYQCPENAAHEYCFRDDLGEPTNMETLRKGVKDLLSK